jgi:hypothetical protein
VRFGYWLSGVNALGAIWSWTEGRWVSGGVCLLLAAGLPVFEETRNRWEPWADQLGEKLRKRVAP